MATVETSYEKFKQEVDNFQDEVSKVQEDVKGKSRNFWLAGLGLLAAVEEEAGKFYEELQKKGKQLIEKGEAYEKTQGDVLRDRRDKIVEQTRETYQAIEKRFGNTISAFNAERKTELDELNTKLQHLEEMIAALTSEIEPKKTATRGRKPKTTTTAGK